MREWIEIGISVLPAADGSLYTPERNRAHKTLVRHSIFPLQRPSKRADARVVGLRRVAVQKMEAGDPTFWKMLLDRVWPTRVELTGDDGGPVTFADLPRMAREE